MGGVFYLFIRGVRPSWPDAGIWHDRPARALIEELDDLFSAAPAGKGASSDHA